MAKTKAPKDIQKCYNIKITGKVQDNQEMREHNKRLEKILEKLAET